MSKNKIPHGMQITFEICDAQGHIIHTGKFRMDIDQERRAFAERSLAALVDGMEVYTWWSNRHVHSLANLPE